MNGNDFGADAPISSSWGGSVALQVNASTTTTPGRSIPANRSFSITYTDVPAGICLSLITAAGNNFQSIRVGSEEVVSAGDGGPAGVDPARAASTCAAEAQTVVFTST